MHYGAAPVSELHKVRVRGVAHGGAGVGTEVDGDGRTWFVRGALPEELVQARVDYKRQAFFVPMRSRCSSPRRFA